MLIPLTGGFYQAKSLIANAQKCLNLYPEKNTPDSPVPYTHYLTPGLTDVGVSDKPPSRWEYTASNGVMYVVFGDISGSDIYYCSPNMGGKGFASITFLASFASTGITPTIMADNGLALIIVDGSLNGWAVDLATNEFGQITDPNFLGAGSVGYVDTFFAFNRPGTNQFYISLSEVTFGMLTGVPGEILTGSITAGGSGYPDSTYFNVPLTGGSGSGAFANITVSGGTVTIVTIIVPGSGFAVGDVLSATIALGSGFTYSVDSVGANAFDPLDIAAKVGYPDELVRLIIVQRLIWLIGKQTTEIWYNSGAADFPFQIFPNVLIQHGCVAPYSVATQDLSLYWLSLDQQGQAIVLKGKDFAIQRISTHALENEFSSYGTILDAIGVTYQQEGHTFYVITFPTADKSWAYDEATELWHERGSLLTNVMGEMGIDGNIHKVIYNSLAVCNGIAYVGDYFGNLWELDLNNYTEDGNPIPRIRSFPHIVDGQKRLFYKYLIADMQVGTEDMSQDGSDDTPPLVVYPPVVSLRISNDRGKTFGNAIEQPLGALGEYLTSIKFSRLGMARDRVFELSWSSPTATALNGAWIEVSEASS